MKLEYKSVEIEFDITNELSIHNACVYWVSAQYIRDHEKVENDMFSELDFQEEILAGSGYSSIRARVEEIIENLSNH